VEAEMTEPAEFFTAANLVKIDCTACGVVRYASVDKDISVAEMRKLKPHILAAMGWLMLPDNELSCEHCSRMLESTVVHLPRAKALTVQNAVCAQMRNSLIQVDE